MSWFKVDSCQYYRPLLDNVSSKLACFDLDSTLLVKEKCYGFMLAYADTLEVLKHYHQLGFTIVIFSNQKGPPWFHTATKAKIEKLVSLTELPIWSFLATGSKKDDIYRKPSPTMFQLLLQLTKITVDKDSFYCGDAVGLSSDDRWFKWSDVDSKFAQNIGLTFKSPNQLFKGFGSTMIKETTQLIITCGQNGSGWDYGLPYLGKMIDLGSKNLVVIDHTFNQPIKSNKAIIYYLIGPNPTIQSRRSIIEKLGIDPSNVEYNLYCKSCYDKSLEVKDYDKIFQFPPNYTRIN